MDKPTFQREVHKCGAVVKTYHNDNLIFNAEEFMQELFNSDQKIEFSGTGTPHKNGAEEG